MKVIVNTQTPLTVEDEKGNILFQWLPEERLKYITEIRVNKNNIDMNELAKQLEKEMYKAFMVDPKYL